jgi:hypothetical protein
MAKGIPVQAARIPDRDRLVEELRNEGLDAKPVGEVEIEVVTEGADADDVYEAVERRIMSIGAPFVPIKHEGIIYVRPPVG